MCQFELPVRIERELPGACHRRVVAALYGRVMLLQETSIVQVSPYSAALAVSGRKLACKIRRQPHNPVAPRPSCPCCRGNSETPQKQWAMPEKTSIAPLRTG